MRILNVYLLGGLQLTLGDEGAPPLTMPTIPGTTTRSLLIYLITHRDRAHTRDLLAGMFWPEQPNVAARRRLSHAMWRMRQTLQVNLPINKPILLVTGDTVQFNPDFPLWVDAEQISTLYDQYQQKGLVALKEAVSCLDLHKGDFLAGYYDDWVLIERERLRKMLLALVEQLLAEYKLRGDFEQALIYAQRLTNEDPWREEAHREVMRLCHLLGRDVEALHQFERCPDIFGQELGVKPSPETEALAVEIAAQTELPPPPLLPVAARPPTVRQMERPDH